MKNLVWISIVLAFLSSSVRADSLNNFLNFYVGADSQLRVMRFKKGFGDNILKRAYPQGNLYAGFMLSDNVGLEAGYESTAEMSCKATLVTGDCCAGRPIVAAASPAIFKSKLRIKGPHIGLILFHPIQDTNFKLLASVGISSVKGTIEIKGLSLGVPPVPGRVRTLSKHRECVRLMAGAQYLTESGLGFRGTMNFIQTRKVVIKKSDDIPAMQIPSVKLRESVVYGLGAFWIF